MAKRKNNNLNKALNKSIKRNPLTWTVIIIFLIIGLATGIGTCLILTKNDEFSILGEKEITLNLGQTYTEEGAKAVAFGKNVSSDIKISTDLDVNTPGVYAVTYTCKNFKYKNIKRIRYVTVLEAE